KARFGADQLSEVALAIIHDFPNVVVIVGLVVGQVGKFDSSRNPGGEFKFCIDDPIPAAIAERQMNRCDFHRLDATPQSAAHAWLKMNSRITPVPSTLAGDRGLPTLGAARRRRVS